MTPALTVAVLTYNGEHLLPDCLTSIFQQAFPVSTELLILDNGSTVPVSWPMDCTPKSYPKNLEMVRIEWVEPNCGNVGGQNRCFEHARGEWVLFVANDVRLGRDTLAQLWYAARRYDEHLGQIQPMLMTNDLHKIDNAGLRWQWPGYGISNKSPIFMVDAVTSSCYLMRKWVWEHAGGFDEQLISSHEDIDMGLRLQQFTPQRLLRLVEPYARVRHLGNATLQHTLSNHRAAFHRARRMVIQKHYRGIDQWTRLGAEWLIYYLTGGK